MQKRFNTLLAPENRGGNLRPVSGASVTVTDPNGALATIYSDNGVTVAANPLTSSATGEYEYYAADGRYTETIVKAGRDTVTISDILLEDPADSPSPTSADMASTADSNGAGLVGFSALAEYAAGTVGKWLVDLKAAAGSALVGFIHSGTGAVATTVQAQLRGEDVPAPIERGHWVNVGDGANIHRLRDRVFVGDGCDSSGENAATANETWLTSQMGAHYFERAAQFMSLSTVGKYGGVFATRSSDQAAYNPTGETAIGVVGVALNDFAGTAKTAWAAYLEAVRSSGVNGFTHGVEIAVKNKGSDITQTPYSFNNGGATHGIWFAGGADPSYDGAPANPSAAAMVVVKNGSTWNRGLVFTKDSLTGADGTTGTAIAIQMAKGHKIDWQHSAGQGAAIWSEITTAANAVNLTFFEGSTSFVNNNKLLLKIDTVATPVNGIGIAAIGSSGGVPNVYARGDDTNVDLGLYTKGTGVWRANYASTAATTPANFTADRLFKFKDSSGNVYYIPCRSATW